MGLVVFCLRKELALLDVITLGKEQALNLGVDYDRCICLLYTSRAETECSGNVTKENIARLTSLGVDYISSGALTHLSLIHI